MKVFELFEGDVVAFPVRTAPQRDPIEYESTGDQLTGYDARRLRKVIRQIIGPGTSRSVRGTLQMYYGENLTDDQVAELRHLHDQIVQKSTARFGPPTEVHPRDVDDTAAHNLAAKWASGHKDVTRMPTKDDNERVWKFKNYVFIVPPFAPSSPFVPSVQFLQFKNF